MSDIVLEFDNVWKKFRRGEHRHDSLRDLVPALLKGAFAKKEEVKLSNQEFWAIRDLSFQVKRGEALGIIGPNGAGKSTTLKLFGGILRPNSGRIAIKGRLSALIEIGAGFHPDLTGRENVYLNGAILGMNKKEIDKKFDEIVEFSELADFIDTPVKRYSSGMYARLGFSVAAHVEPDILLVDEVLSVGDWAFQKKCLDKMDAFVKKNVTIIFISHNLQSVVDLCSRAILMRKGTLVAEGPADKVVRQYLSDSSSANREEGADQTVWIDKVSVVNEEGQEASQFGTGETCSIIINVRSNVDEDGLAITLDFLDERNKSVFNTSSARMGCKTFSISAGSSRSFRFDTRLHLVGGNFFLKIEVKKYQVDKIVDVSFPAAIIFVKSEKGMKGIANLYPVFKEI